MRRSAAPSFQSSAKRIRFLSPLLNSNNETEKENDLLDYMDPEIAAEFSLSTSIETKPTNHIPNEIPEEKDKNPLRSSHEILKLLFEEAENNKTSSQEEEKTLKGQNQSKKNLKSLNSCIITNDAQISEKANTTSVEENDRVETNLSQPGSNNSVCHYSVLWCKRSAKKHKIWEGDGVLIVKNRSAILKNSEGKEIDRGLGYKFKDISSLEEGSIFCVGSKECEIQSLLSSEMCASEESLETSKTSSLPLSFQKANKKSTSWNPSRSTCFKSPALNDPTETKGNLINQYELILPSPSTEHQQMFNKSGLPLTEVKIDSFLAKLLRPHQKEGIIFMYKCILGFQHDYGEGVILADEMGLGKTLQCIALVWTLFKQGPYGGKRILKHVIIITPSSLVVNWKKEFHKWLGEFRLPIFVVDKKHNIKDYVKTPKAVLIISYEMFLRSAAMLSSMSFDLVICDEGHRIKNLNVKISNVVNCLSTTKRILLTGTPIQNDLEEFYSIVDFVNPGTLGTLKSFRTSFERPIVRSRAPDCSEEEKEIGEEISEELNKIITSFMLRRTQEVINSYLPPKSETVIFCRPTELQKRVYESLLGSRFIEKIFSSGFVDSSLQLVYISMLRKLCNHPFLLFSNNSTEENPSYDCLQSAFPPNYQPSTIDSGKMKVLENMLVMLFSSQKKEKVVIVSGFTKTLNLIENFCKEKGYFILRLDGSTATSSRQDLVDVFNRSYTKYNIFLLSNKAGGVGLNLIGASRIILYDVDWNPANDLQAMARIWRDGQKHSVYVYRLLTTGTIEEKIYQRQLSKQCLSISILNPNAAEKFKFSQEELKDLFTFHENTECLTHDLIGCSCLDHENLNHSEPANLAISRIQSPNYNIGMEELMNWQHICNPISTESVKDSLLTTSGSDITFLFRSIVNNH